MITIQYAVMAASANDFSACTNRVERVLRLIRLAEGTNYTKLFAFEFNDWLRGELSVEFLNGDLKPGSRERL
jgi:hypothetical protein